VHSTNNNTTSAAAVTSTKEEYDHQVLTPKRVSFSVSDTETTPDRAERTGSTITNNISTSRSRRRQRYTLHQQEQQRLAEQHREYLSRMHGVTVIRGKSHDCDDPYQHFDDFVSSTGEKHTFDDDDYHDDEYGHHSLPHHESVVMNNSIDPTLFIPMT
jgi:hypothetical protein